MSLKWAKEHRYFYCCTVLLGGCLSGKWCLSVNTFSCSFWCSAPHSLRISSFSSPGCKILSRKCKNVHVMEQPSKCFCTGVLVDSCFSAIPRAGELFWTEIYTDVFAKYSFWENKQTRKKNPTFIKKKKSLHVNSFKHSSTFTSLASWMSWKIELWDEDSSLPDIDL